MSSEEINMDLQGNGDIAVRSTRTKRFIAFLTTRLCVTFLIGIVILIIFLCIGLVITYEKKNDVILTVDIWKDKVSEEQKIWYDAALDELKLALNVPINTRRATNVILFIGDGMGPNTVTAARIYKHGEEGSLSWEKFPHMGLLKTYCSDKQVPDSSSSATALFGGAKTNYETAGVDSFVALGNCSSSLDEDHHVESILKWAQDADMRTGFVTNTRVTHATSSALYAHSADKRWECESKMPFNVKDMGCKDIARQLIENAPGKNLNVVMGGGRQCLVSNVKETETDPIDTYSCYAEDGRNLIANWEQDKITQNLKYAILNNTSDLLQIDIKNTEYVLGIFANGHMAYEYNRDKSAKGMPSLREMTSAALKILVKNDKGFLLVVEGGLIDQAHHRGHAKQALSETVAFDESIAATLDIMKNHLEDTLIIVTSDHAHTLSINGYPERGKNILDLAQKSKFDGIPYTTLSYATGHFGYQVVLDNETTNINRKDSSNDDTFNYEYVQQVAIKSDENTHGGVDVAIHAIGPMAHLFHKVHEQSYVAHVISYACRIGRFRDVPLANALFEWLKI